MATQTPRFDKLLRALAFKLRDPIKENAGSEDGRIFKLDSKVDYINRAYGSMRRKLSSIMKNPERIFSDYFTIVEKSVSDDVNGTSLKTLKINLSDILTDEHVFDIKDVYFTYPGADGVTETKQIGWIDPDSYMDATYGLSQTYKANDDAHKYFYTVINKQIWFVADQRKAKTVIFFLKNVVSTYKSKEGEDLIIPREYNDFLLTLAAYEAMIDLGDNKSVQKAVMYDRWVKNELDIVAIREKLIRDQEDDKKSK